MGSRATAALTGLLVASCAGSDAGTAPDRRLTPGGVEGVVTWVQTSGMRQRETSGAAAATRDHFLAVTASELIAYRRTTGTVEWRRDLPTTAEVRDLRALNDSTLLAIRLDSLSVLQAPSGHLLWSAALARAGAQRQYRFVDSLHILADDGALFLLDPAARTARQVASVRTLLGVSDGVVGATRSGDELFVQVSRGDVVRGVITVGRVSLTDYSVRWRAADATVRGVSGSMTAPVVSDSMVFGWARHDLLALARADGAPRWHDTTQTLQPIVAQPVAADSLLYTLSVSTMSGRQLSSGRIVWANVVIGLDTYSLPFKALVLCDQGAYAIGNDVILHDRRTGAFRRRVARFASELYGFYAVARGGGLLLAQGREFAAAFPCS